MQDGAFFLDGLFQYPPVACFRHPARAGRMAFPTWLCRLRVCCGIAMQHDPRYLGPVSVVRIAVQQAQVGDAI